MLWLGILVWMAVGSASCGPRRVATAPVPVPVPPVAQVSTREIEALIERGCFRCLSEALTMARERGARQLAFEAASLLTLRAGELGVPQQNWLTQARELAVEDSTWASYLDMVAVIPPDPLSGRRDDLLVATQTRNRARGLLSMWRASLQDGSGSVAFRRYLELSLDCLVEDSSRERDEGIEKVAAALPDVPLLTYRLGICNTRDQKRGVALLTSVQQRDSEFVDLDYALGRYALNDPEAPNQEEAMRLFQSAAAAFPESVAIRITMGNVYQSWEEWKNALAAYDAALALMPAHPDGLLGRTISLSNLEQHKDAIDTATRLIEGGQWFLGQAFYWRAWNYFNMGENALARADADRTRTLMVNSAVYLLSGLIEWRAPRLPSAEAEFEQSMTMDFGQCLAPLYLGGVRIEQAKVREAIAALQQARQCFDLSITVHRASIEKINSGRGTPASKARGVAREERLIADAERRRDQAVKAVEQLQKRVGSGVQ